jgi:hypothetical protein
LLKASSGWRELPQPQPRPEERTWPITVGALCQQQDDFARPERAEICDPNGYRIELKQWFRWADAFRRCTRWIDCPSRCAPWGSTAPTERSRCTSTHEGLDAARAATGAGDLGQRSNVPRRSGCEPGPRGGSLTPASGGGLRHFRAVQRDTPSPRRIRYRTPSAPASSDRRPLSGHTRSFRACRYPRFCSDWP